MGAYLSKEANFAVVGCGEAGKAAGWFHGYQLVAGGVEGARLSDVVEPFLLSEEGRADARGRRVPGTGGPLGRHRRRLPPRGPRGRALRERVRGAGRRVGGLPLPPKSRVAASPVETPSLAEASLRWARRTCCSSRRAPRRPPGCASWRPCVRAKDAPLYVAFDLLRAEHVAGARAVDGDVVLVGRGGDGDDDAALAAAFAARPEGLLVSGMTQELDACARGWASGGPRSRPRRSTRPAATSGRWTGDGLRRRRLHARRRGRRRVRARLRPPRRRPAAARGRVGPGHGRGSRRRRRAQPPATVGPPASARGRRPRCASADPAAAALRRGEPAGDVARAAAAADALDLAGTSCPSSAPRPGPECSESPLPVTHGNKSLSDPARVYEGESRG